MPRSAYYEANKVRLRAYRRAEHKLNRAAENAKMRLRNTGFTAAMFSERLATQRGHCAICEIKLITDTDRIEWRGRAVACADHCHETGRQRGVLCRRCNTLLGYAGDAPDLLRRAIEYLERWRKKP